METAKQAVDMAIKLGKTSACISYFGGEPLLKFDMIKELTHYAEKAGRGAGCAMYFRLSTNGTLFTESSLRFCRDHQILFAVSLDGDRAAHDAQRPFEGGLGSFDVIDAKLDMILEYNPLAVFTSIITPLNADRMAQSVEYMWNRGIRYFVHQPDFSWPDWDMESFEAMRKSYEGMADFYISKAHTGEHFFMSIFDEKLKPHARKKIELGETCDFGARKLSIAPDGNMYPCVQFVSDRDDAKDYIIGDVINGPSENRDKLVAANKAPRTDCEGCELLGRCANYCGCTNWQTTGSLTKVSPFLCEHERMLIPIADDIGNVLWKEKNKGFMKKHYRFLDKEFGSYGFD